MKRIYSVRKWGFWRLAGPVAASAIAMTAASAAFADPFVVNVAQVPGTLDPVYLCDITDNGYVSPFYATLLRYERKPADNVDGFAIAANVTAEDQSAIAPGLAESWTVSEDGLLITFAIRPGLKFASGRDLDAYAVAASLNRALDSGGCGAYFAHGGRFGTTQSVEALDSTTVAITLLRPEPLLIYALTQPNLGIVDVETAEANGGSEWLAINAAASGPYTLVSYQPGVRAELAANPNWWGEPPLEPEVVVNFISDPSALLLQARNGAANVTLGMPRQAIRSLISDASLRIISVPANRWLMVSLPMAQAPFDNPKVREALSYATPYDAILNSVLFGFADSFFGIFPPSSASYKPEFGSARPFDMERAKALMLESGVETPVSLTLTIREGLPESEQIATILQGAWGQLGVQVAVQKLSASAFNEAVIAPTKTGALMRFDGPAVEEPAWLLNYDIRCDSDYNTSDYCNGEIEALLDEAIPFADPSVRQEYWDRIAAMWLEDVPRIPIYSDRYTVVLSADVNAWDFAQNGPFEIHLWGR